MPTLFTLLAVILGLAVLSGCSTVDIYGTNSANLGIQSTQEERNKQAEKATSAFEEASKAIDRFPTPGPRKLVRVTNLDGGTPGNVEEVWQARYPKGQFGGELRLATFGSGPKTFNVWAASEVESHGIGFLMFERLFEDDPWTGEPQPKLAKSFSISSDKLEYTVVLRQGLKWSDAHPITADDVVFTYNTLVKGGYGQTSSNARDTISVSGSFPEVKKVDDLTIKFRTKTPFVPFLKLAGEVPIAPKHILEPVTKKGIAAFEGFWSINMDPATLVASGPFTLERYIPAQRVELKRNPYYAFVAPSGKRLPYLDRFIVFVVPDQNTMILKFYGGELDFLDIRSVRGFDAALMKQREAHGNFRMYNLGADDGGSFLMFNMNRRKSEASQCPEKHDHKYYVDPIKQRWFNDLNFRQAVNHAINRQRIVANVLRGVGLPLYTCESPASIYWNSKLKPFPQDLIYSMELLHRSGFSKIGDRLVDRDGHPVEFNLITNSGNTVRDATCIMIVNDLKKLGIKVDYQPIDFNIMIDKTSESLDWESVMMALSGDRIEPCSGANVWKPEGRLHEFDVRLPDDKGIVHANDVRPWELEIGKLFDQGATTFDIAARHKLFDRYQAIAYEQAPFIYLYAYLDITAARNTIGNYNPTPYGVTYTPKGSLHNVEEIYIKPVRH